MADAKGSATKHFPDETTLGLPETPALSRIIERAEQLVQLGTRFRGLRDWTAADKEEIRAIVASVDRMWEARRAELVRLQLEMETGNTAAQPLPRMQREVREGMHYPKRPRRSTD